MDKQQEINAAAFDLFSMKGYHFTEAELAAAVGIKASLFYSIYENKEQILERMIRKEVERYYECLKEKAAKADSLSCKNMIKELYYFIIDFFSDYKRLRIWRTIPLIPNEKLQSACSRLIAEKDNEFNKQVQLIFFKGLENGEIRSDAASSAIKFYFCMIQGILDGMLLYPKNRRENTNADKIFEAYWDNIRTNTAEKGG